MLYFAPCSLWKRLITPYISFKINSLLFCFKLTMNGSFTLAIASWKIANIWTSLSLFWEMALCLESWWKNQFFVCAVWRKEHLTGKYCSSSQNFPVKFYSAGYVINVNTFDESLVRHWWSEGNTVAILNKFLFACSFANILQNFLL